MSIAITTAVLDEARMFFEDCGSFGCEGTALIAGIANAAGWTGNRLVIPDQTATPVPRASVTVTDAGDIELLTALTEDQRYLTRIHSHPALAFHSPTDDGNPVITHEGAVSIVVPFFGLGLRQGLDTCAVYVRRSNTWVELPIGPARDQVVCVDD